MSAVASRHSGPEDAPGSFEAKIAANAQRFDLRPLLVLLSSHGYKREQWLFESTSEGHSGGIVRSVKFQTKPMRCVLITLNLGLLGDNTLLPSYFFELVERGGRAERFHDFVRFFDHKLIENFIRAVYPEDDREIYRSWIDTQRSMFKMLGVASVSTLQWLFKLFFPELHVHVSRRSFPNSTVSHAFRTGESRLDGTGILGRVYEAETAGLVADLCAEEEVDQAGRAWPGIVRSRLSNHVLPMLAPFGIPLVVRLRVLSHASWVRVDFPFADEHGYLGYERIRGDANEAHTIVIWRGITGQHPAD